jgi:hypothetical protein
MRLLLLSHFAHVDYMADMLAIELFSCNQLEIALNKVPLHLFKCDNSSEHLYGRGFTICRKLDENLLSRLRIQTQFTPDDIKSFDYVVYLSVRRFDELFADIANLIGHSRIICIDGEDDPIVSEPHALSTNYFKRELSTLHHKLGIKPISFFIPSPCLTSLPLASYSEFTDKKCILAPCDPRDRSTYIYNSEETYYEQYNKSLFGYTQLKNGWDCLRHYEIIACGSLPLFEDISKVPPSTLHSYPKQLQSIANTLHEIVENMNIDTYQLQYSSVYKSLVSQFQQSIIFSSSVFGSLDLKRLLDTCPTRPTALKMNQIVFTLLLFTINIQQVASYVFVQSRRHFNIGQLNILHAAVKWFSLFLRIIFSHCKRHLLPRCMPWFKTRGHISLLYK